MAEESSYQELADFIIKSMEHLHIPGVALGIIDGEREYSAGFGVTNLENPLPVTADTLFQIGSITKTVTATAMMRLVESGLVNLDAPIRTYLPDLRLADESASAQASLRHVFTHTGGWTGDFFDDAGLGDEALRTAVGRMDRLPQETPLGQVYSYNNAGFYLAGRVIEVITGKTFEAAAQELVLGPLGMNNSFFFAQDAITYRVAAGHDAVYPGESRQPNVLRPWWLARVSNPLGGLASTIQDMLRYARFHMGDGRAGDGTQLLRPESIQAMQTPTAAAANGEFVGISWFLRQADGVWIVRHGGATNGQMATLQMAPSRRFAILALTNSDRGSEMYLPMVRKAFKSLLGVVESEPLPRPAAREELAQYAGIYTAAAQDLKLEMREDELLLQEIPKGGFPTPDSPPQPAPPATRLALCGPDQAVLLDEPFKGNQGEFLRNAEGEIAWLRLGGRVHRRLS